LISGFIRDVIAKTKSEGYIDVSIITNTIQRFTKSKGLCIPKRKELLDGLAPYLVEDKK